jgi:hypothetical protein
MGPWGAKIPFDAGGEPAQAGLMNGRGPYSIGVGPGRGLHPNSVAIRASLYSRKQALFVTVGHPNRKMLLLTEQAASKGRDGSGFGVPITIRLPVASAT